MAEVPKGFRTTAYTRNRWLLPLLFVFWGYLTAVAFARGDHINGLAGAILCLFVAWIAYRGPRVEILLDKTGVTIRNLWRTHRLAWTSIREFRLHGRLSPRGAAVLQSGRKISIQAVADLWRLQASPRTKETLEELEAARIRYAGNGPSR